MVAELLGAVVDDLNMIPLTYNPAHKMIMPFMKGNYGLRAMGIDHLFNVGSYVAPTHLRVVEPEYDRSSITMASLGDLNGDGDYDEWYETGTIFKNTTDVTLTIKIDSRSGAKNQGTPHPGTIDVYYMNAEGDWIRLREGEIYLAEGEFAAGHTFPVEWSVTDLEKLLEADTTVELRTVTSNSLQHPIDINGVDF